MHRFRYIQTESTGVKRCTAWLDDTHALTVDLLTKTTINTVAANGLATKRTGGALQETTDVKPSLVNRGCLALF